MNKLSIEYLIKLLSMSRIGRKTAFKLIQDLSFNISNDNDLMDFVNENGKRFRLPVYTKNEFENAFSEAEQIINNSEKLNIKMISFQDENYPILLSRISDFPLILNYIGNIKLLSDKPCVAIIGTREATDFGIKIGIRFGEYFALKGFNIVSGLALGCDTAGHKGALNVNGITTAILAHGLDKVYPKENQALANDIVDKNGLLLSEYFVNQSPLANYFVERDRIQAGLSLGVIVIETDIKGGTMHTVKYCLENNRILASVNFPIEYLKESKRQGNQLLIKEGKAIPIYNKDDVENLLKQLQSAYNSIGQEADHKDSLKERLEQNLLKNNNQTEMF